jgi:hypothetical protein
MSEKESARAELREIAIAVVIAIAGLLIAYTAYQTALWAGEEEIAFSRANVLQTESVRMSARADTQSAVGIQILLQWFNASAHGDTRLAEAYEARFPPTLRKAFDAWLALRPFENPDAPASPLAMPQYNVSGAAEAEKLKAEADASFKRGQQAKRIADSFGQAGTVLSIALFFGGISQVFRLEQVRMALLVLAALACALGVVRILTLPMIFLFSSPP